MPDRFSICLPFTLAQECPFPNDWSNPKNYSYDSHDPGGATMCGIIQREYDLWRKGHDLACQPVELIPQDEGYSLYQVAYWLPRCPNLSSGLDLQYFDTSVNMGPTQATRILQVALGINNDGIWGPQTDAAVTLARRDLAAHIEAFTNRRTAVYKILPGFPYFGTDWLRRAEEMGAQALKMAA